MDIQKAEWNDGVIYTIHDEQDTRPRQIGFVIDPIREVHRLSFTNGMVDLKIKDLPVGLLYQHWLKLALDQACHLCAFEQAIAETMKGEESCTTKSSITASDIELSKT